MSKRSNWDERKIEESLKQFPAVKDNRSKDELFQSIQRQINTTTTKNGNDLRKKKKRAWYYPAAAAAAAVFLIILILPSLVSNEQQQLMTTENYNAGDMAGNGEPAGNNTAAVMDEPDSGSMEENFNDSGSNNNEEVYTAENDNDDMPANNGEVNNFAAENEAVEANENYNNNREENQEIEELPGEEESEQSSYVTVPVPRTMEVATGNYMSGKVAFTGVVREFPESAELDDILLYSLTSEEFNWGYSLQGQLQDIDLIPDENTAVLDFSEDHRLMSLASEQENILREMLREIFGLYGFSSVILTVNGEPGIDFGQAGPIEELEDVTPVNRGYYLYKHENGDSLFIRGAAAGEEMTDASGNLLSFEDTLEKMKSVAEGAWYSPAIPEELELETSPNDNEVTVTIEYENSEFETAAEYDLLFESVILAASDFNFEYITFEGVLLDRTESFEDGEKIKVRNLPLASR
ncbi:hypothetical protein MM300_12110 [Evansella sp. LMS18]|uniref:hypothetical protein n=1 Tax=Evansella sp. LMS18 TaxID=2924033 RepID=UPI0020D11702|nr:hypothetical protein [Evansella sp. LMS18]UTR08702.1 hypothetical protein MM300_12110 [Evansella sp. LMS18]